MLLRRNPWSFGFPTLAITRIKTNKQTKMITKSLRLYKILIFALLICLSVLAYLLNEKQSSNLPTMYNEFTATEINRETAGLSEESIPLPQSDCIYPELSPNHDSITPFLRKPNKIVCKENRTHPNLFDLTLDGHLVPRNRFLNVNVLEHYSCTYRELKGTLAPKDTSLSYGKSITITSDRTAVNLTMFEVRCRRILSHVKTTRYVNSTNSTVKLAKNYAREFAQILPEHTKHAAESDENRLSIEVLELDSVSINQFKRQMSNLYDYFQSHSNWFVFDRPNKVMDNSLGNLLAVFTGKKFVETPHVKQDNLTGEFRTNSKGKVDFNDRNAMGFLWDHFRDRNCTTLLNIDPYLKAYGFFFYPREQVIGFKNAPVDHFLRPFYYYLIKDFPDVYYRPDSLCRHEKIDYEVAFRLIEQWQNATRNKCSFAWTQIVPAHTHERINLFNHLREPLWKYFTSKLTHHNLNRTVLLFMGDHGHRGSLFRYTPHGQIEERQAFFALRFPPWYVRKYPERLKMLRKNTENVMTHYDIHETLMDIVDEDHKIPREPLNQKRAHSLFNKMSNPARSCEEMHVPKQYCLCLNSSEHKIESEIEIETLSLTVTKALKCKTLKSVKILNFDSWAANRYVRSNVKHFDNETMERLSETPNPEIKMYFYTIVGIVLDKIYFHGQIQVLRMEYLDDYQLTCMNILNPSYVVFSEQDLLDCRELEKARKKC